ncbi:hypothetical protein BGZ46_005304 [Entomortierella lignicola]|nr:hypothetical protein BGZ46_005304 [Entomortierella lignicola]
MNRSTTRAAALLAGIQPSKSLCRCRHARIRFRSTLVANSTESPSFSYNPDIGLEQKFSISNPPQVTPQIQQKTNVSSISTTPSTIDPKSTSSPTSTEETSLTYQGHTTMYHSEFPELEPAPFPKDIHSYMSLASRELQNKLISKGYSSVTHNDLQSYKELNRNTKSTIYKGTLFEYQTQEVLMKCLGIYTQRTAGAGDLGVDLRGTWFLPTSASPRPGDKVRHLKVIVQCKSTNTRIGPNFVRELQGSLSYESQPTMAILAISSDFTKHSFLPYAMSLWPMALVVIDVKNHKCKKLMWNKAAEKVMHGVQLGEELVRGIDGKIESRPVLCYKGSVLERVPGPYLNKTELDFDQEIETYSQSSINWHINFEPDYLYAAPDEADFQDITEADEEEVEDSDIDLDFRSFNSSKFELPSWCNISPSHDSLQMSQ